MVAREVNHNDNQKEFRDKNRVACQNLKTRNQGILLDNIEDNPRKEGMERYKEIMTMSVLVVGGEVEKVLT